MGLFSETQINEINAIAKRSKAELPKMPEKKSKSINSELNAISETVKEYFKDSKAICITTEEDLHDYISKLIESGYAGIDTETTGLDRYYDHIVGASLYYPGGVECYIPMRHMIPIFEEPYPNQLSYEQVSKEFRRIVDSDVKLIFANADFDLSMIYKDLHVDFCDRCYYDVILAWRVLKENELHNGLKDLYNKYVMRGEGDPKRFSDFFSPQLFPYCKPDIAKLYAANDAKITYELFLWQLPYCTKDHPKCKKAHLEAISDLLWNVEFPLIKVCQDMHRLGIYLDKDVSRQIQNRYHKKYDVELQKLKEMVQDILDSNTKPTTAKSKPFTRGQDFNPTSPLHVKYLLYDLMDIPHDKKSGTGKEILADINLPITNQILKVRSLATLIGTFVDKMPNAVTPDSRIHAQFKQIGASTGRFSCISKGTKISTPAGDIPIEDIKCGDYVYCYDINTNRLKLGKVKNSWYTGERNCIKLYWKSKYNTKLTGELICTPDHFLRTQDFRWVMAKDLKPTDSLLYVHRRVQDDCTSLYAVNGQGNEEEHAWVRSEIYGHKGASEGFNIHHVDGNRNNNDPRNLALVTPKSHTMYHLSDKSSNICGQIGYSFDELYEMCETVNWELSKIPHDLSTVIHWLQQYRINYILKYTESYNKRSYIRNGDKQVYKLRHLPLSRTNLVYSLDLSNGDTVLAASYFAVTPDKFISACDKYEILSNHAVYKLEYLDGLYSVYDLEIEGYHNFIAGELCVHNSAEPNLQNIPSHATDIRHIFRATPGYVMLSSDYSAQEPRLTSFLGNEEKMIDAFKHDRDVYATIASNAFGVPYEECLEFHPITHEYQPEGKARRGEAKFILLGITYGRSVPSIADQLYGKRKDMTEEEKIKKAQKVYDSVINAFPGLRDLMNYSQAFARKYGYVETILGRRRHLPDMRLPEFEFEAMPGYVNPDVDPLDVSTLSKKDEIPERIVSQLKKEFSQYKYYGQIYKRTKELYEDEKIKVINNRPKINDASRQVLNCVTTDTQIWTDQGWKFYDQLNIGDLILSMNEQGDITADTVLDIHTYDNLNGDLVKVTGNGISCVCTNNHRWPVWSKKDHRILFLTTEELRSYVSKCKCAEECDYYVITYDDIDKFPEYIE